tara:strand:- start:337 stop:582 length:246 start_codon:yes stop_codon:yes gene_type:complete
MRRRAIFFTVSFDFQRNGIGGQLISRNFCEFHEGRQAREHPRRKLQTRILFPYVPEPSILDKMMDALAGNAVKHLYQPFWR